MALQKPFNLSWNGKTIDTDEDNELSWQVSGDMSTAIEIKVLYNSNNTVAWSLPKTNTYATKYKIPKNSFINGEEFQVQVIIYNQQNQSAASDFVLFQTSSRPLVTIPTLTTIGSSAFTFTASYQQAQSIPLKTWNAYLYNADKVLLSQSGIQTSSTLSYLAANLQSEKQYFIEFQATSNKGLTGTSGLIAFNVLYTQPTINISLTAENYDNASIKLSWNVIQIIFKTDVDPPTYIGNEKIDLSNNRIWADEGFSVEKNFTIKLWIEAPKSKEDLLTLKGANGELKLQYRSLDEKFHLFKTMTDGGFVSSWESQQIVGDKYFICVQQIDNNYNLIAESYS